MYIDKTETKSELHLLRCSSTVAENGDIGHSKYEDIFCHDVFYTSKNYSYLQQNSKNKKNFSEPRQLKYQIKMIIQQDPIAHFFVCFC